MKFTPEQTRKWFGERLEFLGINQEQLSKKAGIAESDISRYKAQKARPRVEMIDRIADALEVDTTALMIALGAIDADTKSTPKMIEGMKNSEAIWELSKLLDLNDLRGDRQRRAKGEGSLSQRSDGLWVGTIEMGWKNGKRIRKSVSSKTHKGAQLKLLKLKEDAEKFNGELTYREIRFSAEETSKWFGLRLEFLGINQVELGVKAGIDQSDISRYKAQKGRPRIELIERLALALEVDVLTLMIAIGAITADFPTTPPIIKGQSNYVTIWKNVREYSV